MKRMSERKSSYIHILHDGHKTKTELRCLAHIGFWGVGDWRRDKRRRLRTKGSLVPDLAGSLFDVALRKSHLPPA